MKTVLKPETSNRSLLWGILFSITFLHILHFLIFPITLFPKHSRLRQKQINNYVVSLNKIAANAIVKPQKIACFVCMYSREMFNEGRTLLKFCLNPIKVPETQVKGRLKLRPNQESRIFNPYLSY